MQFGAFGASACVNNPSPKLLIKYDSAVLIARKPKNVERAYLLPPNEKLPLVFFMLPVPY